jgi:DNA-binding NtrC family response regulator
MMGPTSKQPSLYAGQTNDREFRRSVTPTPEGLMRSGGRKNIRILIVDDEEPIRRAVKRSLGKEGYDFAEAPDGSAGLDEFRKGEFDLVISDRQMPGMDGLKMLREIKKLSPQAKVVIISGGISREEAERFYREGALTIIEKPFDIEALKAKVREVLNGNGHNGAREFPSPAESRKPLRVVFVDDDPDTLFALREGASLMGYETKAFSDPTEALEHCRTGDFDVLVSDFHMPGMNGLQLLTAVKALNPLAKVVICSAAAGEREKAELYRAGAADILQKPLGFDELQAAIEAAGKG